MVENREDSLPSMNDIMGFSERTAEEIRRGSESQESEPSVVVDRVHQIYHSETRDKKAIASASPVKKLGRYLGRSIQSSVHAVNDISFVANKGESIGILGLNGSGKSTLLRMIAGVEAPTKGVILARSQPTLLGVGAALLPALTGIQNIRLGCYAIGLTPEEVEEVTPRIVELSGIEDAVYRPMQTYSSGMAARLRFAINAAASPDILLIDEALGTGDAAFKEKSEEVLNGILEAAGTVFLVSHASRTIEEMCNRVLWLNKGELIADGDPEEISAAYRLWAWHKSQGQEAHAEKVMRSVTDSFVPTQIQYNEYVHIAPHSAPSHRQGSSRRRYPIRR